MEFSTKMSISKVLVRVCGQNVLISLGLLGIQVLSK